MAVFIVWLHTGKIENSETSSKVDVEWKQLYLANGCIENSVVKVIDFGEVYSYSFGEVLFLLGTIIIEEEVKKYKNSSQKYGLRRKVLPAYFGTSKSNDMFVGFWSEISVMLQ